MQIRQITFKDVVDHVKSEHTLQQSGKISLTAKKLASLEAEILTLNNEEKKSIVPDNPLQEEELRDAMLAYNLAKLRVDAKDNHIAWLRLQEYNAACDEFKKEQEKTKFNLFNKMRKAGNTLEMANGYLNLGCIVALLFGSSAAFAFSLGAQSVTILSTVLEYVEFALPVALGTVVLGGIMDLVGLAFSKEKIDTAVAMATFVDGYTKVVLGSIGLVMSFGVVAGGSVAIPFLFLGIILAGVLKENELLKSVKKDITNLNNSIRHDEELLKYRIDTLRDALKKDLGEKATPKMVEEAIKNDPRAMYLALKISENQQKLQIRQAEEKSLQKTRSLMLYMGALSVGMLIASTFFPPASIAFAALGLAGLACFLLMNRLVAHEKQALNEEIKAIKTRPLATEQVLNTALGIKTVKPVFVPAPKTSYWTSVCSIFKKESKPIVNASHAKDIPKFALNY